MGRSLIIRKTTKYTKLKANVKLGVLAQNLTGLTSHG